MSQFRRFTSGQKLKPTAAQVNAWTDAAELVRLRPGKISDSQQKRFTAAHVPVKNNRGAQLPAFSVLELTEPLFDATASQEDYESRVAFSGGLPSIDGALNFVITQRLLEDGDIDPFAVVQGVTLATLSGPEGQLTAGPESNSEKLITGQIGAKILHDPGPEGSDRIGYVLIGCEMPILLVTTTEAIIIGASGECRVMEGDKGNETDSELRIQCYNRFGDVAANTYCVASPIGSRYELTMAECDATYTPPA